MTREEFIDSFVHQREKAWMQTNTHSDPFGTSKPKVTDQHRATWHRMAEEAAAKEMFDAKETES